MKRNNNRGYYYSNEKLKHTLADNFKFRRIMISVQNLLVKHCKKSENLYIRYRDLLYADKRQYESTIKRKTLTLLQYIK